MDDKDVDRFWSKVAIGDGCWIYLGRIEDDGYGRIKIKRKQLRANRVAWMSWFGEIAPGLVVMHTCDEPRCCRPSHLVAGTQLANMKDKYAKGRHGMKLDADKARYIRGLYAIGFKQRELAVMYDVKPLAIYDVIHRNTWPDVN